MLTTSLQKLFNCGSWIHDTEHFQNLMRHLGKSSLTLDEEAIDFSELVKITSIEFAIDCTSSRSDLHKTWREFSLWCCQPFLNYVTVKSCLDAVAVAERFQVGLATLEELTDAHQQAFTERLNSHNADFGVEYFANQLACDASNPNIEQSISECFNAYALAMDKLGIPFEKAEQLQKAKFLDLVH
jgi:hypothetical protein